MTKLSFRAGESIGNVDSGFDDPLLDFTKGDRHVTVVDGRTYAPVRTIDMRFRLDAAGRRDLSDAVRPAVFTCVPLGWTSPAAG